MRRRTAEDEAFSESLNKRLPASYGKPQSVQDRVYHAFIAAAHAREAARREAEAERGAAYRRARHAEVQRESYARPKAERSET
jgi:hypothetical protein